MDINLTTRQLYRLFGDHEVISNSQLLFSSRRSLEPKAVGRNMLYICTCCVVPLTLTSIVRAYQGKWKSEKGSRQHPAQMSGVSPKPTMASRSPRRHLQSGHLYIGGRLQSARAPRKIGARMDGRSLGNVWSLQPVGRQAPGEASSGMLSYSPEGNLT